MLKIIIIVFLIMAVLPTLSIIFIIATSGYTFFSTRTKKEKPTRPIELKETFDSPRKTITPKQKSKIEDPKVVEEAYLDRKRYMEMFTDVVYSTAHNLNRILLCLEKTENEYLNNEFEWLTNKKAIEKYKNFGIGENGEPLKREKFNINGITWAKIEEIKKKIIAATIIYHEVYNAGIKEKNFPSSESDRFKYLKGGEKYTITEPVRLEQIEILKETKDQLLNLAAALQRDEKTFHVLYNDYYALIKGHQGENVIKSYIDEIKSNDWYIYQNAILPCEEGDGRIFENDFIIVTKSKIYLLEIKNYENGYIEIHPDGKVDHYNSKDEKIEESINLLKQCFEHVNQFRKLLQRNGVELKGNSIECMAVISNNEFRVFGAEYSPYKIIRDYSLITILDENEDNVIDSMSVSEVIHKNLLPEKEKPRPNKCLTLSAADIETIIKEIDKINIATALRIKHNMFPTIENFDPCFNYITEDNGDTVINNIPDEDDIENGYIIHEINEYWYQPLKSIVDKNYITEYDNSHTYDLDMQKRAQLNTRENWADLLKNTTM